MLILMPQATRGLRSPAKAVAFRRSTMRDGNPACRPRLQITQCVGTYLVDSCLFPVCIEEAVYKFMLEEWV